MSTTTRIVSLTFIHATKDAVYEDPQEQRSVALRDSNRAIG